MISSRRLRKRSDRDTVVMRRHRPDYQIVLYMGLLMLIGLVIMYAIGPQRANVMNNAYNTDFYTSTYFFIKQLTSLILALFAFIAMALIPYHLVIKHAGKILAAGFIACIVLFIFGNLMDGKVIAQCSLGACRWFDLGPFGGMQPAEFLKFGLLLFAAVFLGTRAKQGLINDRSQTLIPLGVVTGLALFFVVVLQKDMGTGISIISLLLVMLFMAGIKYRYGLMILGLLILVGIIFILIAPHRIERVVTFLSGDSSSVNDAGAYHITHAKIAIGTGGLAGVGIGNSVQATGYLPEAINDSVFAIIGETFGFVGLVAILSMFTALLIRLLKVSDHLPDPRLQLIVVGVFGWVAAHVVLNVNAMIGLLPLTGITLPLLSYGGTSMVFIAAALGLAFQLSRYTVFGSKLRGNEYEDSQRRRGFGRTRDAGRRSTRRVA